MRAIWIIALCLWPATAWAADTSALETVLLLVALLGVAYLITHLALERIARRFAVVTGAEYVLVGLALVPALGVIRGDTLQLLTPALTVGTGALGLYAGLRFEFRSMSRTDLRAALMAIWVSVCTVGLVAAVPGLVLYRWGNGLGIYLPALLYAGAVALVADPGPTRALTTFLQAKGPAPAVATRVAELCTALAILGFGVLFCFYRGGGSEPNAGTSEPWVWLLVQLLLGSLLGLLFRGLLRPDMGEQRLLTVLLGMVIFTSGLAFYLRVSTIFANFIMGVVLINGTSAAASIRDQLASIRRPFTIVLFFFAGALLNLDVPWWSWLLAIPFVALRFLGRWIGGALAHRFVHLGNTPLPSLGPALLAPGGLSVAIMLNYRLALGDFSPIREAYAGILVGLVASEILAYLTTRRWLLDAADVPPALAYRRGDFEFESEAG